jgi:hypothetical protein
VEYGASLADCWLYWSVDGLIFNLGCNDGYADIYSMSFVVRKEHYESGDGSLRLFGTCDTSGLLQIRLVRFWNKDPQCIVPGSHQSFLGVFLPLVKRQTTTGNPPSPDHSHAPPTRLYFTIVLSQALTLSMPTSSARWFVLNNRIGWTRLPELAVESLYRDKGQWSASSDYGIPYPCSLSRSSSNSQIPSADSWTAPMGLKMPAQHRQ